MSARRTVLVVDDEPDVVKSVQDLLRYDYKVLGATRAKDALDIIRREEVHVIMTDQRMPEITGVEFLRQVRGEYPEAMRLLFTGYADIRAVIDAINQGSVYRYITKPWDPDELTALIREAVERYDLLVERKRLVKLLQDQNQELERANAELKHANELKQAFIQVASHELRTPLTILLGLTQLAMQQESGQTGSQEILGRIEQAGKRLQRLVDQLVSMLRAGNFEMALERKPTNLGEVLRGAADDVAPFARLRGQTLSLDLPGDLAPVNLDPAVIRDCVSQLLLNAVKFTPDDGTITLSAREDGPQAEIRVSDTGNGIDDACRANLFQPFFTGFDVSRHSSGHYEYNRKGLGLGLSIVRSFVEMHGGTVRCESNPGQGSTFTIRLPKESPAQVRATNGTNEHE